MMQTFTWFEALTGAPHLARAVWLTAAAGMGMRRAAQVLGIHRDTVRARRNEALDRMAEWVGRATVGPRRERDEGLERVEAEALQGGLSVCHGRRVC